MTDCSCKAAIRIKGTKTYGLWEWVEGVINYNGLITSNREDIRTLLTGLLCDVCKDKLFTTHKFKKAMRNEPLRCSTIEEYAEYRVRGAVTNVLDKMIAEYEWMLQDADRRTDKLTKKLYRLRDDRRWMQGIIEDAKAEALRT